MYGAAVVNVTRRPYGSVYGTVTKLFVMFSRNQAYSASLNEGAAHTATLDHVCGHFIVIEICLEV